MGYVVLSSEKIIFGRKKERDDFGPLETCLVEDGLKFGGT